MNRTIADVAISNIFRVGSFGKGTRNGKSRGLKGKTPAAWRQFRILPLQYDDADLKSVG